MNKPASILAPEAAAPARFTADEFLRMFDLGAFTDRKVELVHGEIFELNSAYTRHASAVMRVARWFLSKVHEDRLFADAFIRLDDRSVRAFDVTITKAGSRPGRELVPAEVLVGIEVADSSIDRDLGSKMRHYAAAGIEAYMVVDLTKDCVHDMRNPGPDGFARVQVIPFGGTVELPGDLGRLVLD